MILIALIMIGLTWLVFWGMSRLYKQFPHPLLLPIITSTVVLIVCLSITHIPYKTYMLGGIWINQLLGPAVVALGYPLYKSRKTIMEHFLPILAGVFSGTCFALLSVLCAAYLFGIKGTLLASLLPKSVTTPIAIAISTELGGDPALTVTFVMIAGIFGAMAGPFILRLFRVKDPLGRGIGYGSASHAIGTSKAIEEDALTGAVSSIAMILCGLLTSILLPIVNHWLH